MIKQSKKLFVYVVAIMLFASCMLAYKVNVSAATYSESESNDSYSLADNISLGSTMKGVISSTSDKDYYKITPNSNGYININFNHTYESSYDDWDVYTYIYSDGQYTQLSYTNIDLRGDEYYSLPSIGAKAGVTYYILVQKCCSGVVGKSYSLSTSFNAGDNYEKELNNVYSTATNISLPGNYVGNVNSSSDKDYYKITPNSNGYININFNHTYENSYDDWNVYTYEYSNGRYTELSSSNIDLNKTEIYKIPSIGAKAGGTYYIVVEKCCSGVVGKNYVLSTSFNAGNNYEKELNNVYSSATDIALGASYTGNISISSDKDYYRMVPNQNGYIYIKFNHTYENSYDDWNVYTYVYNNGSYNKLSTTNIDLKHNSSISIPTITANAGGIYYIVVEKCCSGVIGKDYTISTGLGGKTQVVPGTTLTSVKNVKGRKLSIKWKKNTSVNGYVVQMATNKSFTKGVIQKMVYNQWTASLKSQKLKKKKTYYVRICSYKVVNGQIYYSSWSNVKKAKIKK